MIKTVGLGDGKSYYEVSPEDHKHLVGIENGQIHEFESGNLARQQSGIANKTGFELTYKKLTVLEQNTLMFRAGVAKTLFPLTLIAWRRRYPLASCMTIVIQMHNGLTTSVIAGTEFSWIRSQLECNLGPIQRLIALFILLC